MYTTSPRRRQTRSAHDDRPRGAAPAALFGSEKGVAMTEVSWQEYVQFLGMFKRRRALSAFLDGTLELMSPSHSHELYKNAIHDMILGLIVAFDLPYVNMGSATFRSEKGSYGVEPDDCWWIGNAARVAGKTEIDPSGDPPPDIMVEVDLSRDSSMRLAVYRAMKVPEVWGYDGKTLVVKRLTRAGDRPVSESISFPRVPVSKLNDRLADAVTGGSGPWFQELIAWARETQRRKKGV